MTREYYLGNQDSEISEENLRYWARDSLPPYSRDLGRVKEMLANGTPFAEIAEFIARARDSYPGW